ncbi:ferric reductase-like transmembrane domain-containing protein [Streptomyces sp. NPDC001514]
MNPRRKIRSSPGPNPGLSRQVQGGLSAAALVLLPLLAIGGSDAFRAALDFTTGVLSLVSLTASVAWGLIATDRLLLSTRHRLLAQGIHRATAVASLGFLLLHATVKVSLGHVELLGALIPFGLGVTGTSGLIGFGSLAGLLMVIAGSTGAARSALAGNIRTAARWRALHMLAYPAWCSALMHGLYTGRPAATWVVVMYCLALAGVAAAVSLRLLPPQMQRRLAERLIALVGSGGRPAEAPEQPLRDLSVAPLPGTAGDASQPQYEREFPRRRPAGPDEPLGRPIGQPLGSPLGAPVGQPLAPPRGEPRRIAAPAQPLYEAAPPPSAEPATAAGSFPGAGPVTGGPLSGEGPGTGISAAYRAVSLAGETASRTAGARATGAAARTPGAAPAPSGEIPLAERIPMTEELPVVDESGPRPEFWPTPSPPPPGQAFPPPVASSRYETGVPYETGTTPQYADPYDPGSASAYGTGSGAATSGYDGLTPTSPLPRSLDDTQPSPGPLYPPPAGEPWNAPAGDRP